MSNAALDFIHQANKRTSRAWLLLGGALLATSVIHYQSLSAELHDAQQEWAAHSQKKTRVVSKPKAAELNPTRQAAIKGLSMNWVPLFDAVEASASPKVALLAIEPDASKRTVRLNLEAKDKKAMQDYVQGLAAQAGLANVSLLTQETQLENPLLPIRFSVGATWLQ